MPEEGVEVVGWEWGGDDVSGLCFADGFRDEPEQVRDGGGAGVGVMVEAGPGVSWDACRTDDAMSAERARA